MAKLIRPQRGVQVQRAPARPSNVAPLKPSKQQVAVPDELEAMMEEDAGKGVSQAPEDNITPMLTVLQPMSPQAQKKSPDYIEGAEPGAIWLKGAAEPLREEILFQPVRWNAAWVEWIPRDQGSGFVTSHKVCPPNLISKEEPGRKRPRLYTKSGHEIIFTRYWAGFVYENDDGSEVLPYVIPFQSTGHTVFRKWMGLMNNHKTKSGKSAGSFYYVYRLPVVSRTNASGTWYEFAPEDAYPANTEAVLRARRLYDDLESGVMQMEQPAVQEATEGLIIEDNEDEDTGGKIYNR